MEEFRRYLELRNYQKKNVYGILSMVKEHLSYIEKGNLPSDYIRYLRQRKHKIYSEKNLNINTVNNHLFALKIYKDYLKNIEQKERILSFVKPLEKRLNR